MDSTWSDYYYCSCTQRCQTKRAACWSYLSVCTIGTSWFVYYYCSCSSEVRLSANRHGDQIYQFALWISHSLYIIIVNAAARSDNADRHGDQIYQFALWISHSLYIIIVNAAARSDNADRHGDQIYQFALWISHSLYIIIVNAAARSDYARTGMVIRSICLHCGSLMVCILLLFLQAARSDNADRHGDQIYQFRIVDLSWSVILCILLLFLQTARSDYARTGMVIRSISLHCGSLMVCILLLFKQQRGQTARAQTWWSDPFVCIMGSSGLYVQAARADYVERQVIILICLLCGLAMIWIIVLFMQAARVD